MGPFGRISHLAFLCSCLLAHSVVATVYQSYSQLKKVEYDFVIVGGGTAGLTLANRLTENSSVSVLVIEAGDTNEGNVGVQIPFLGVSLPGTSVDWNYTTVAQSGYNGRSIRFARGHVLGGSSSINLLTWNRGPDTAWNRLASATGDSGWSWASVQKYWLKASRLVPPADGHDTSEQVIASAHGNGLVQTSVAGYPLEIDNIVINSSKSLGGRFAFNKDHNAGCSVGFGYMQNSIGGGERSNAATAYYSPVKDRANLDVLLNTRATRLIQSSADNDKLAVRVVELGNVQVKANKEVILATGAVGTPQLLQLSGIGDKPQLNKFGIPTIVNLPDVGKNLQDHPMTVIYLQVNSTKGWDNVTRSDTVFNGYMNQWQTSRQGLFVNSPANVLAYMRLPNNATIFKKFSDPAPDACTAHTEIIFVDGFAAFGGVPQPATGNYITILLAVVSPLSRGTVKLSSSNPSTNPLIDPAFLTSEFDTYAIVQAMNDVNTLINTAAPFKGYVTGSLQGYLSLKTDAQKLAFARDNSYNVNHAVGTAYMSKKGSSSGVVDPDLTVKGVEGLRVVDASVFPTIPPCHPQALVYIVAERTADLIKAKYGI